MRTLSRTIVYGSLAALWLLVGPQFACFLKPSTVVSRFSGEFVCPEARVKVDKVDNEHFRATGCHRRALYRCTGEYGELCQRIGQPETLPGGDGREGGPPPGGEPAQEPLPPQEPPAQ